MAFVFYDTETTGSEADFDQILQFAAIRTDDDLNETGRFDMRCRLLPHVVPSPGALVVTGMPIKTIIDRELPSHYAMMRAVRLRLSSWSPAVFAGYNSLDFDETLLRQALYQTLQPPYLTNTGGNARADVLQIVLAVHAFAPGTLAFATRHDGKPSFRLDQLAPANGFAHDNAHEALADVEATIHVARLIRERARAFWDHAVMLGSKAAAVDYALAEPIRLYTEFHFNRPHHWLVSALAVDPGHTGHVVSYDLAVPPEELLPLDDASFDKRLMAAPKPLRVIKANACPMIQPWARAEGVLETFTLGKEELRRRAIVAQTDLQFRERLMAAHARLKKPYPPSPHVEQQIYDGFPGPADQRRMEAFHEAGWPERLQFATAFEDQRLRQLALRLVYDERPQALDAGTRATLETALARRLLAAEKTPWTTLDQAIDEVDKLLEHVSNVGADQLSDLRDYLVARRAELAAIISP